MDPSRSAFGRLIRSPDELTREQRIDVARKLAGRLQASNDLAEQWLGERVAAGLRTGGSFASVLAIAPAPGSRATPAEVLRRERVELLLLKLSSACGGDARASLVLRGNSPCPVSANDLVDELRGMGAPSSRSAFTRARNASAHGR